MQMTRRAAVSAGLSAALLTMVPLRALAKADEAIAAFTGGAAPAMGGLTLTAPEIAENGNTVPIAVDAPGAVEIRVFADGNPTPAVVAFTFGPLAASQSASTRMRLAGTQDVIAIAKMADGSFVEARQTVKVTIGGCGG